MSYAEHRHGSPFYLPEASGSWSISQGEMNRRTAQAMLTMQETNRIMQSTR